MTINEAIRDMLAAATEAIDMGATRRLNADEQRALRDVRDLARYLSRVEPSEVRRVLGAPGDWGYDSALGRALAAP